MNSNNGHLRKQNKTYLTKYKLLNMELNLNKDCGIKTL